MAGSIPPPRGRQSHPPSLTTCVARALREGDLVHRGDVILAACSGGPDSMALVHVLARAAPKLGVRVVVHAIDHGLRESSADEVALVSRFASSLGLAFTTTRLALAPGGNLQARARDARWKALAEAAIAASAQSIATGHTEDDRAETVIERLLRHAGPRGLACMPLASPLPIPHEGASSIGIIRPLLRARRADVLAHLTRHRIEFAMDPSNADPRFLRVRVRNEVLPLLESLSPNLATHLSRLADMLAREVRPEAPSRGLSGNQRRMVAEAFAKGRPSVQVRVRGGDDLILHRDTRAPSEVPREGDVSVKK